MTYVLPITLALIAGGFAYALSLALHPFRSCGPCDGTGKERDPFWRYAFGECPTCGGKGKLPRLGVRLFQRARYARLRTKGRQS